MGPEILTLIIALIACLAIFWIILKFSSTRITNQYQILAKRFGLELEQDEPKMGGFIRPEPTLYGTYRNREISFSAPGKGLKGSRQIESVLKVQLGDKELKAQMFAKTALSSLGQRGHEAKGRWKSGDEAFDQAVEVRSESSQTLSATLTSERRSWLSAHLKKSKATLYIADGIIAYAELGLIADDPTRARFEDVVEFLCNFAEAVEELK